MLTAFNDDGENIALNKTAYQINTFAKAVAHLAVDGDKYDFFFNLSPIIF